MCDDSPHAGAGKAAATRSAESPSDVAPEDRYALKLRIACSVSGLRLAQSPAGRLGPELIQLPRGAPLPISRWCPECCARRMSGTTPRCGISAPPRPTLTSALARRTPFSYSARLRRSAVVSRRPPKARGASDLSEAPRSLPAYRASTQSLFRSGRHRELQRVREVATRRSRRVAEPELRVEDLSDVQGVSECRRMHGEVVPEVQRVRAAAGVGEAT